MYAIFFRDNTSNLYDLSNDDKQKYHAGFNSWIKQLKDNSTIKYYYRLSEDGAVVSTSDQNVDWHCYDQNEDKITCMAILDISNENTVIDLLKTNPIFLINGSVEIKQIIQ